MKLGAVAYFVLNRLLRWNILRLKQWFVSKETNPGKPEQQAVGENVIYLTRYKLY